MSARTIAVAPSHRWFRSWQRETGRDAVYVGSPRGLLGLIPSETRIVIIGSPSIDTMDVVKGMRSCGSIVEYAFVE